MKNQKVRWMICVAVAVICGLGFITISYGTASATSGVSINETNFPDNNFRKWVVENVDTNNDRNLSLTELGECYDIDVDSKNISSLKGIEYFTNLRSLFCGSNNLTSLDLSNNTKLKTIFCNRNQLSQLDITKCVDLEDLVCSDNQLSQLDITKCEELTYLWCDNNQLTTLNLSSCSLLRNLWCKGNKISSLDISNSPYLVFYFLNDQINGDDETEWICISGLDIYSSYCSYMDVTRIGLGLGLSVDDFTNIKTGPINYNEVKINTTNFPNKIFREAVSQLDCNSDGWLGNFELSVLREMDFGCSNISSLKGIEYFQNLTSLNCYECNLESIDVSKNSKLKVLYCEDNNIKKLDISNNKMLERLSCCYNDLEQLDVSNNKNLKLLSCFSNNICKLDIRNCKNIIRAFSEGKITDVDTFCIYEIGENPNYDSYLYLALDKKVDLITGDVSVALDNDKVNILCGKTAVLKATVKGTTSKVAWKSSDAKVATVDSSGKVTAQMAGSATITASVAGKSKSCQIIVLYKDVTSSKDFWYTPTNYLTAAGVVKGYDNQTKFKPANECTRAQMVTFLWRLSGSPNPKSKTTAFKDVESSDYFYKPVIWAVEKEITTGVSKTKFNPQGVCTRAQTVTFLWRMAGKPDPKATTNTFSDVMNKDYFYKATLWASEKKILAGYADGTFKPQGKCLRRQMVTFLYKYDKYVNGKS